MTVLIKATNTTIWVRVEPSSKAAMKTKNLLNIPAKGGIPASENKANVINRANLGLVE